MTAQSFQCPSCGAPLIPKGTASVISCSHCFTSVIVPEELRQDPDAEQWTTLLYDGFTSNDDNNWLVGNRTSEYFTSLNRVFAEGRYRWEADTKKASSISTAWLTDLQVSDFHLIVNCKNVVGTRADSSWGLVFRIQDNSNYYWFRMTDSKYFAVSAQKNGEWLKLVNWTRTDVIKPNGVNQLEVVAREAHFVFLINGQIVGEVDDNHFGQGMIGLAIEGYEAGEKTTFDFMDFTLRGRRGDA